MRVPTSRREPLLDLLRELRLEAGLNQLELAQKLYRPQSFVSKYERGERRLDILELKDICDALELSLGEFIQKLEDVYSASR